MNLENIPYQNVQANDALFVRTEENKKGESMIVIKNEIIGDDCGEGQCHKITLENGDEWFGWATRTLKRVIPEISS